MKIDIIWSINDALKEKLLEDSSIVAKFATVQKNILKSNEIKRNSYHNEVNISFLGKFK